MSDESEESAGERTTVRAPDDDLLGLMRELQAVLMRTSELCAKLSRKLTMVELAVLTGEHRLNVQRDALDGLNLRVAALENERPVPPPEAA